MLYVMNDWSTIRDNYFLGQSCMLQLVSYGSKHDCSVSFRLTICVHMCTCMYNLKATGLVWKWNITTDCFTVRHSLRGLELHERSNWRATSPPLDIHCGHSLIQHSVCILQARTYIITCIWCATSMTTKYSQLMMMQCFKRTNNYVMSYELMQSTASTYTLQCFSMYSGRYK